MYTDARSNIDYMKRSRAGYLGELTKIYKRVDDAIAVDSNDSVVRDLLAKLTCTYENFLSTHKALCASVGEQEHEVDAGITEHAITYTEYNNKLLSYLRNSKEMDRRSVSQKSVRSVKSEEAKLSRLLAEKRIEQLQRKRARRIAEEELKYENELADARDELELARVTEELRDEETEERPVPINLQSSSAQWRTDNMYQYEPVHAYTQQENRPVTQMNSMVRLLDSMTIRSNLPPLEIVKFSGDPGQYHRFRAKFHEMVETQDLTDEQKMSRLLQFLDGRAKQAVAGFEGVNGGLKLALNLLHQRFGQSYMIAKSCVDTLVTGPNIASNDRQGLRDFADKARTAVETLSSMFALHEVNMNDMARVAQRLPVFAQVKWRDKAQQIREGGFQPSVRNLVDFIDRLADSVNDPVFGRIGESQRAQRPAMQQGSNTPRRAHSNTVSTMSTQLSSPATTEGSASARCAGCDSDSNHSLGNCQAFISKTVRQRHVLVRSAKLCFNCLRQDHFSQSCPSHWRCRVCSGKHHTLLHKDTGSASGIMATASGANNSETSTSFTADATVQLASVNSVNVVDKELVQNRNRVAVSLQTVPVKVISENGLCCSTYALLDSGSQESFIDNKLVQKLDMITTGEEVLNVSTLTGNSTVTFQKVNCVIESVEDFHVGSVHITDAKVINNLNVKPTQLKDIRRWPHLSDIKLPEVDLGHVTVLLGANVPEVQLQLESRVGKAGEPYGIRSVLGWSVIGPTGAHDHDTVAVNYLQFGEESLDRQMDQFIGIDKMHVDQDGYRKMPSVEDERALKQMDDSTRLVDGHYEVGMLWKSADDTWLPNNKATAEARLQSLKRKLHKGDDVRRKYTEFIDNLLQKGYAKRLTADEVMATSMRTWYLPHHAVFHPQKPGKLRVVFDAAAIHSGVSLNSQLLQGPDLTNSLIGVLLRFREERIAIAGDIEAMFLQVRVSDEDSDSLRFLWWEGGDTDRKPQEYKMLRHIFGATDSPSCCSYALAKTAKDNKDLFSEEMVKAVEKDFYVDDFFKSVTSEQTAISLISEVTEMLTHGGFHITKWTSNSREVLASVPQEERARPALNLDLDELAVERALGVQWRVEQDVFEFKTLDLDRPASKRGVLSATSSLYDPYGFVCPVVLEAKNIIQQLWKLKVGWDDPLPVDVQNRWEKWKDGLASLSGIQIPRCYQLPDDKAVEISLHHFADASENGYGMCAYLRFVYASGHIHCAFVIGRSRCAPLKTSTIPRLELQAAALAVSVYQTIKEELTYNIDKVLFWSDSQTTLQYITNESRRFQAYVANRVATIRGATDPQQWRHCPGKMNPADDASRGLSPQQLAVQSRWWNGPEFLWKPEECWPQASIQELPDDDPEIRARCQVQHVSCSHTENSPDVKGALQRLIHETSSWWTLRRRVAWIVRFCRWLKSKKQLQETGPLSLEEIDRAKDVIVRVVQAEGFPDDIAALKTKGQVPLASKLANLKPFIMDGIVVVGGRMQNAPSLSFQEKHPAILPRRHHVTRLIIRDCHVKGAHCGREQTLTETRKRFWIIGGRTEAKKLVRSCFKCRLQNARKMEQVMGDLPERRLVPFKPPFTYCGVDLFGPLHVKWGRGDAKRWGCIFTCLTTRAVYLDLTQSLSTDDFINTLRQFISRRGPPEEMRSDRGTNFVGCHREIGDAIERWNQQQIENELLQRDIKWVFHPPGAAHMSGVWERLVQSTKRHLKALSGDRLLTEATLRTLLAEVEFILNSRPLTASSDDCADYEPLTPNHFLLQRKVLGLPPGLFIKEDSLLRKQWRQVQYLSDLFWKRWTKEYLRNLQERPKWKRPRRNVRVGDLVLVADECLVRGKWPVGRVIRVCPGRDGMVRSAVLKTSTGEYHRPIAKLCLLEECSDE